MEYKIADRITIDSAICNGKPVISGKRITAQTIVEFHEIEVIFQHFTHFSSIQIRIAILLP